MKFVIKTMDRVEGLKKMTYSFLKLHGVKDDDIYIFVSTEKDFDDYWKAFPDCLIILGPKGIVPIDNFIVQHFFEEVYIMPRIKRNYELLMILIP